MIPEQLAEILRKRAENRADKVFNVACDEIRNSDHRFYTTWRKESDAYLAGANEALEIGKLLGRMEAYDELEQGHSLFDAAKKLEELLK